MQILCTLITSADKKVCENQASDNSVRVSPAREVDRSRVPVCLKRQICVKHASGKTTDVKDKSTIPQVSHLYSCATLFLQPKAKPNRQVNEIRQSRSHRGHTESTRADPCPDSFVIALLSRKVGLCSRAVWTDASSLTKPVRSLSLQPFGVSPPQNHWIK